MYIMHEGLNRTLFFIGFSQGNLCILYIHGLVCGPCYTSPNSMHTMTEDLQKKNKDVHVSQGTVNQRRSSSIK